MTTNEIQTRGDAVTVIGLSRVIEIAVNETGLTASQFRALSLVSAGITSSGVIARFLAVRPPTVTTVMNGLVEEGLVDRIRATDDRRRVDYELTEQGAGALAVANDAADAALGRLAGHLPDARQPAAFDGIALWRSALDTARQKR
ncbi:MAG: MarR family transcriptional regulator [Acidimicrobiia bacterium]|nr:MarR family transcriptional regulator [Acidimicrobiia bacterium]